MLDVESFILVGGASSRMGRDKARLAFQGQTAIDRTSALLRSITSRVALVGGREDYVGMETIVDTHERWGALGGIHAALRNCRTAWALIIACDLPLVTNDLFGRLMSFTDESIDAVVPIQPDGRPQPLCALYRRAGCLGETERLIAQDEHSPRALLSVVKTRWIEYHEVSDLRSAQHFFLNVNTPEDYEEAKRLLAEKPNEVW